MAAATYSQGPRTFSSLTASHPSLVLVAGREHPEFQHRAGSAERLREAFGVRAPSGADHHLILELRCSRAVAVAQVGNGKAVPADEAAEFVLGHGGVPGKPYLEMGVELARHHDLDPAEQRQCK